MTAKSRSFEGANCSADALYPSLSTGVFLCVAAEFLAHAGMEVGADHSGMDACRRSPSRQSKLRTERRRASAQGRVRDALDVCREPPSCMPKAAGRPGAKEYFRRRSRFVGRLDARLPSDLSCRASWTVATVARPGLRRRAVRRSRARCSSRALARSATAIASPALRDADDERRSRAAARYMISGDPIASGRKRSCGAAVVRTQPPSDQLPACSGMPSTSEAASACRLRHAAGLPWKPRAARQRRCFAAAGAGTEPALESRAASSSTWIS